MPRHKRNPIEARGRMANFIAKPIGVIDLAGNDLGTEANAKSANIVSYVNGKQVPRTYATDVAREWYLDNIFLPEMIEDYRKNRYPEGTESSADKRIRDYPLPVQNKMIEEGLEDLFKEIGLPTVHEIVDPFWLDGKIVAPGDIVVGYGIQDLKRYLKPSSPQRDYFYGKIAILRYDWMPNDESTLMKMYNKYTQEAFYSEDATKAKKKYADVIVAKEQKSQSELYKSRKSECADESVQLYFDYSYFYNAHAFVVPTDPHAVMTDFSLIAPLKVPTIVGKKAWEFDKFIVAFSRELIRYDTVKMANGRDKYEFAYDQDDSHHRTLIEEYSDSIQDKLHIRFMYSEGQDLWNLGGWQRSQRCDFWDSQKIPFAGNNIFPPNYSMIIGIRKDIQHLEVPVLNNQRGIVEFYKFTGPFTVVFPSGLGAIVPFPKTK